jgi:hypothetical protein
VYCQLMWGRGGRDRKQNDDKGKFIYLMSELGREKQHLFYIQSATHWP